MGFNRRKMEDERRHAAEQEAAALAQLGRLDEARASVQAALALDPSLSLRPQFADISLRRNEPILRATKRCRPPFA